MGEFKEDFVAHVKLLVLMHRERASQAALESRETGYFKGIDAGLLMALEAFEICLRSEKEMRSIRSEELLETRKAVESDTRKWR